LLGGRALPSTGQAFEVVGIGLPIEIGAPAAVEPAQRSMPFEQGIAAIGSLGQGTR
jgi:hypothetical protein